MNIELIAAKNNNKKSIERTIDTSLKGVLADNYLKNQPYQKISFDNIQDSLLINSSDKYYTIPKTDNESREISSGYDVKKAFLPLAAGTIAMALGCYAVSACVKKSSENLLKTKSFEQLPDLAINMNIKEEPHFAIYRAVRDPNYRNIAAAYGVFIMSGITIACKNFTDGVKEIWLKKRSADIEANLQENLINVERDTFSGKLKIVNDIMNENLKDFERIINSKDSTADFKSRTETDVFAPLSASFKGGRETQKAKKTDKKKNKKLENLKYPVLAAAAAAGFVLLAKLSLSNFHKSINNTQKFAGNYELNVINAVENMSNNPQRSAERDIPRIIELMKSINAKPNLAEEIGRKYNLPEEKIKEMIEAAEKSRKTIFADAPEQLGGIPKKVQYYCYIDEPRGHLYNWIVNSGNKFTKIIFYSFTIASSIGYLFKQTMDALKEAAVMKENAKTDLSLKKRLAAIELKNFKAKKECAVMPLRDSFKQQAQESGKSKEELKQLADNILREIKNGPPYVFG